MITVTVKGSMRDEGATTVALAIAQTLKQLGYKVDYESPGSRATHWMRRFKERISNVSSIAEMSKQRSVMIVDTRADGNVSWRVTYPKEE